MSQNGDLAILKQGGGPTLQRYVVRHVNDTTPLHAARVNPAAWNVRWVGGRREEGGEWSERGEPGARPYQISHLMSSQTVHTRDTDERYLKVGRTCTPNRTLEAYGDSNSTSTSGSIRWHLDLNLHSSKHVFLCFWSRTTAPYNHWDGA